MNKSTQHGEQLYGWVGPWVIRLAWWTIRLMRRFLIVRLMSRFVSGRCGNFDLHFVQLQDRMLTLGSIPLRYQIDWVGVVGCCPTAANLMAHCDPCLECGPVVGELKLPSQLA